MKMYRYIITGSLIIFLFLMESSSMKYTKSIIDKERYIMENICNEIINCNKDIIQKNKKIKGKKGTLILVVREEDSKVNSFNCYSVSLIQSSFFTNDPPTYLFKKQGVYTFVYLSKSKPMPVKEIPRKLFKDGNCYGVESCWLILICNETYKYKVIDIFLLPFIAVKQFQEFSCEGNEYSDKMEFPIVIEKAIVDTVVLNKVKNKEIIDW